MLRGACRNGRIRNLLLALLLTAAITRAAVPVPESYFGHPIGADRQLLDWDKVVSYFEPLADSSDRIRVAEYGRSAENRPMIVATIAAPETLRNLDRYREIQRRLADPADHVARAGRTDVPGRQEHRSADVLDSRDGSGVDAQRGGVRLPTDYGKQSAFRGDSAQYDFAAGPLSESGRRGYRDALVSADAGHEIRGDRIRRSFIQKYVGHDNNRDWYIFSQPETRATISQLHNVWHPEIVYDVHQQGQYASRMFIPPWLDPSEPNIDPILVQEMNTMGTSMASD